MIIIFDFIDLGILICPVSECFKRKFPTTKKTHQHSYQSQENKLTMSGFYHVWFLDQFWSIQFSKDSILGRFKSVKNSTVAAASTSTNIRFQKWEEHTVRIECFFLCAQWLLSFLLANLLQVFSVVAVVVFTANKFFLLANRRIKQRKTFEMRVFIRIISVSRSNWSCLERCGACCLWKHILCLWICFVEKENVFVRYHPTNSLWFFALFHVFYVRFLSPLFYPATHTFIWLNWNCHHRIIININDLLTCFSFPVISINRWLIEWLIQI